MLYRCHLQVGDNGFFAIQTLFMHVFSLLIRSAVASMNVTAMPEKARKT